jgi:hypothetical protein
MLERLAYPVVVEVLHRPIITHVGLRPSQALKHAPMLAAAIDSSCRTRINPGDVGGQGWRPRKAISCVCTSASGATSTFGP